MYTESMAFDPEQPYNDLPMLPPSHKLESDSVFRALVRARAALAELKEAGKVLPDQSVILRSMVLQEAKLSSQIENIVTTNDELYRQIDAAEAEQSPQVREIRRYSHALWAGLGALRETRRFDIALILEIASELLESKVTVRSWSGTRIGNPTTRQVVYTPPEGEELIRGLLANLVEFVRTERVLDPLTRIAVAHYQFEAIHPFIDGNGRTGRVMNVLLLVHEGLLELPVLYLSQEILSTRKEYYRLLRNVTEQGDWEPWLLYFIESVEAMAKLTKAQFGEILTAIRETREEIRARFGRTVPSDLIDLIYKKPYTRIGDVVEAGIAKRQSASEYLRKLADAGILDARKEWREMLFLNKRLLEILSL